MFYLFHGDDQFKSRESLNQLIDQNTGKNILRLDAKEIDPEKINNFLNSTSLFSENKLLVLTNLFSANKSILDKVLKIIASSKDTDIAVWQDKTLLQNQIKNFPQAKISYFRADNQLFLCLNNLKPKNGKVFLPLYHKVVKKDLYDLFLFLLKNNIRKQLSSYSRFDQTLLKTTYLKLIKLDFYNKSGQLTTPKELILEKILVDLMEK